MLLHSSSYSLHCAHPPCLLLASCKGSVLACKSYFLLHQAASHFGMGSLAAQQQLMASRREA